MAGGGVGPVLSRERRDPLQGSETLESGRAASGAEISSACQSMMNFPSSSGRNYLSQLPKELKVLGFPLPPVVDSRNPLRPPEVGLTRTRTWRPDFSTG